MSEALRLPAARLMEPKRHSREVDALIHRCLVQKGTLTLQALPEALELAVTAGDGRTARGPTLGGSWRSPCLRLPDGAAPGEAASLLLVPLLFTIARLSLPHHQVFTLGRDDRTLADFFMRNVFHAAARGAGFALIESDAPATGETARAGRDLARTYTWIAKAALRDAVFERGNSADLVLAACHVELPVFGTPLLARGAAALRQRAEAGAGASAAAEQERQFWTVREQVMGLYA